MHTSNGESLRLSKWGPISLVVLTMAGLIPGCGAAPPAEILFADFVPFGRGRVSTDIVLPPTQAADPLLGIGWAPWTDEAIDRGLWVYGHDAEFRFYAALTGDQTLLLEAQAFSPAGSPLQMLTVVLNGEVIRELPLEPALESYEIHLPGSVVIDGWNQVRMEFSQALRPSETLEGSRDKRFLAARFRRIAVRSSLNRPLWPERPDEISVSDIGDVRTSAVIEMPTDSVLDVLVEPHEGQQLVGSVDISLVGPSGSVDIHTTVELLDDTGEATELFRRSFDSEMPSPVVLRADLTEWVGELVQVRVRSWGNTNAYVRWEGLGLSAPTAAERDSLTSQAAGWGRLLRPTGGDGGERPDVFVIMLDAARGDAFRGPEHPPSTPNIDALASESTNFSTAWAASSWTGQSVPSIFTGYYPDAVGAEVWGSQLPAGIPTLAELLSADGYFTALWTQHGFYRGSPSLQRGYQALGQREASSIAEEGRASLPSAEFFFEEDRPTFAMIHLLPPHDPYEPPTPFRGRLTDWYRGNLEPSSENLDKWQYEMPTDEEVRSELIRYARDRYWENVEFADHLVGRLLQMLKDAGRYEDALIVVLADHGEAFFEHGRFLHTVHLYEEFIHVPLFIKWPSWMSGYDSEVTQPVTLVDVAPTLIEGLQLDGGTAPSHGMSLIPAAFDDVTYDRGLYSYTRRRRRARNAADPEYAFRAGKYKIVYSARHDVLELFDLEQDPGEENDIHAEDTLRAKYLLQQAMLQKSENLALLARSGPQQAEALDPETRRRLRALGYIQ